MSQITVVVYFLSHPMEFRIASTVRAQRLTDAIVSYVRFPYPHMLRILYDGFRLHPDETLGGQGIENGDAVDVIMQHGGGYGAGLRFQSPRDIEQISLEIALARGVSAERIGAPGFFHPGKRDVIEWSGSLRAQGVESLNFEGDHMQERETGETGGSVIWEMSLNASDSDDESLVKLHCSLDDTNAVVLAFNEVAPYIQTVLRPLSLGYNTCESFFLNYYQELATSTFVAIRFLEQSIYEQLAPLAIFPPPDVVTRVVLLYQAVREQDLHSWTSARERAQAGPSYWNTVAGFDERSGDRNLYRALEWRAINVPARS